MIEITKGDLLNQKAEASKTAKMTASRAAILKLAYIFQMMDVTEDITQIVFQKLSYFLQASGWDLKLRFEKGAYGPYADNLRHVLNAMEGHFISGIGDGSSIKRHINICSGAIEQADKVLAEETKLAEHIQKVSQLMVGFNSEYLLELLSTVHWIATHNSSVANNYTAIVPLVKEWTPRKAVLFKAEHIEIAWQALINRGWIKNVP